MASIIKENEFKRLSGTKISLSVCIKADSDSFTENEQQEIISEFGIIAQILLSRTENAIGCKKDHTSSSMIDSNSIADHFGLDASDEMTVFDSANMARELVALSLLTIDTPTRITIDYDPNYPFSVLRKTDISNF